VISESSGYLLLISDFRYSVRTDDQETDRGTAPVKTTVNIILVGAYDQRRPWVDRRSCGLSEDSVLFAYAKMPPVLLPEIKGRMPWLGASVLVGVLSSVIVGSVAGRERFLTCAAATLEYARFRLVTTPNSKASITQG
jgi:hypothetical protein